VRATLLPAGLIDQDVAHGRGREEVAPAVPVVAPVPADEPDVGLVDQGGGLEGLARLLVAQPGGGQLPQLVVDEREQAGGGMGAALSDGGQHPRDVGHE
jgi:hypothetical protein